MQETWNKSNFNSIDDREKATFVYQMMTQTLRPSIPRKTHLKFVSVLKSIRAVTSVFISSKWSCKNRVTLSIKTHDVFIKSRFMIFGIKIQLILQLEYVVIENLYNEVSSVEKIKEIYLYHSTSSSCLWV